MKLVIGGTRVDKGVVEVSFMILFLIILFFIGVYFTPIISAGSTSQTANTTSNATITKNVAISRSTNLTAGILFGTVTINTNDNNATGNFNGTNYTQYWITIDSSTTIPVDLCIKANDTLRSGTYTISNANYTWSNSSATYDNYTAPLYPPTKAITTTWQACLNDSWTQNTTSITNYYRFALDIPAAQVAGTYTNEISFYAVENTTGC